MARQDQIIIANARAALAKNPNDQQAEFIVRLWDASENLYKKNVALQAQVVSAKEEVEAAEGEVRLANSRVDLLETRLANLATSKSVNPLPAFDAAAWFESQEAIVTAEAQAE